MKGEVIKIRKEDGDREAVSLVTAVKTLKKFYSLSTSQIEATLKSGNSMQNNAAIYVWAKQ